MYIFMLIIISDFILLCFLVTFYKNKFQKMQQQLNILTDIVNFNADCSINNSKKIQEAFNTLNKKNNNNTIIDTTKEKKSLTVYKKLDNNVIFYDFEKNLTKFTDN